MGAGTIAGDLPTYFAGALAMIGWGPVGSAAGAFGFNAAVREMLVNGYLRGTHVTPGEFYEQFKLSLIAAAKEAPIGAATVGGGIVAGKLGAGMVGKLAAEIASLNGSVGLMNQEIPSFEEFMLTSTLIAGVKAAAGARYTRARISNYVEKRAAKPGFKGETKASTFGAEAMVYDSLSKTYVAVGKRPGEVYRDSQVDRSIPEDLLSSNLEVPRAYRSGKGVLEPTDEVTQTEIIAEQPRPEPAEPPKPPSGSDGEPPRNLVRERIHEEPESRRTVAEVKEGAVGAAVNEYTTWIDKHYPLELAVRALTVDKDAPLPITQDPFRLNALFAAQHAKGTSILMAGPIDFATHQRVGPGLPEILRPLGKGKKGFERAQYDLNDLRVAQRVIELKERGTVRKHVKDPETGKKKVVVEDKVVTGVPIEDLKDPDTGAVIGRGAKSIVADADPALREADEAVRGFERHVLKYVSDAGVISADAMDAMFEMGALYAPINRAVSEEATRGHESKRNARNPVFNLKGSELEIIPPLRSLFRNTYLFTALADRNVINSAFVDLVEASPIGDQYAVKVKQKVKPVQLDRREIKKFIDKYNNLAGEKPTEESVKAASAEMEGFVDIFRPVPLTLGRNQISRFVEGKRELWEIKDQALYESFTGAPPSAFSYIKKAAQVPATTLRAGAILNLDFWLLNLGRDTLSAYMLSESGFVPVWDSIRGINAMINSKVRKVGGVTITRNNGMVDAWLSSGAPMAEIVSQDRHYYEVGLKRMFYDTNIMHDWRNAVHPLRALQALAAGSEQVTRIGVFARGGGGKKGASKEQLLEAGEDSRRASLDFARGGVISEAINSYVPFFKITTQGKDRVVRTFKDHKARTSFRLFNSAVLPIALIYLFTKDLDWFKRGSKTDHDLFMRIPVKGRGTWDRPDHILRIPRGHEAGVLIGKMTERAIDFALNQDPKAFDGFMSDIARQTSQNILPQGLLPYLEAESNYSYFMQRPLIPRKLEDKLPELQFRPYTTELTKTMASLIAEIPGVRGRKITSPIILDNTINALTGGLGRHVKMGADLALREAGILPSPPKPAPTIKDIPGVGAMFSRNPSMASEALVEFWDSYSENQRIYNTLDAISTMPGGLEARKELRRVYGERMINPEGIRDSLQLVTKIIHAYNDNTSMDPTDKRQLTDDLVWLSNSLAIEGNKFFDKIDMARIKQIEKLREQE
jgi:hypothetical protein